MKTQERQTTVIYLSISVQVLRADSARARNVRRHSALLPFFRGRILLTARPRTSRESQMSSLAGRRRCTPTAPGLSRARRHHVPAYHSLLERPYRSTDSTVARIALIHPYSLLTPWIPALGKLPVSQPVINRRIRSMSIGVTRCPAPHTGRADWSTLTQSWCMMRDVWLPF